MTRLATSKDVCEEFLPGIPNEITIQLITPKLSWRDLRELSTISPGWKQVLQARQIYDDRVRAGSTETYVVIDDYFYEESRNLLWDPLRVTTRKIEIICLYSLREKICVDLPKIHHPRCGIPKSCQCVSVDGNLYVLGGAAGQKLHVGSKRVYMLDVAGNARQWKQCANMLEARLSFGAGVIDGKIYVFGGISRGTPVSGSEVYDPKVNAWSPIKPMPSLRFHHQVTSVGEELLVHAGCKYSETWLNSLDLIDYSRSSSECTEDACHHGKRTEDSSWDHGRFHQIYNPVKDEWRSIHGSLNTLLGLFRPKEIFFTAEGKVHALGHIHGIRQLDLEKIVGKNLQSFDFFEKSAPYYDSSDSSDEGCRYKPISAVAADDVILVTMDHFPREMFSDSDEVSDEEERSISHKQHTSFLLHGKGFGVENEKIVWDWGRAASSSYLGFDDGNNHARRHPFRYTFPIMCPIRL